MPIEKITERIIQDAKKEAEELKKEARAKAKLITDEGEKEAKSLSLQIIQKAKREAIEEAKRITALARLAARDEVLAEKRKILEEVFKSAWEKILNLPDKEYLFLMKKLLHKAISLGTEEIITSPSERKYFNEDFLREVNAELVKKGKEGKIKLSLESREIKGGFILRSGRVETNCSLSTFLEDLKGEIESEVLKILLT